MQRRRRRRRSTYNPEKPKNQWSLLPYLFPSKAGGFPACLDPINLPSGRYSSCGKCREPLQFLLQLQFTLSGHNTSLLMRMNLKLTRRCLTTTAMLMHWFLEAKWTMESSHCWTVLRLHGDGDKKSWATFQERISRVPEQVLRYCRYASARPLWPTCQVANHLRLTFLNAANFGGPRGFELQILPQLLCYFGVNNDVDSLDWATIVVYTCVAPCDGSIAYKEEFAWVQLASQSTIVASFW